MSFLPRELVNACESQLMLIRFVIQLRMQFKSGTIRNQSRLAIFRKLLELLCLTDQ